MLPLKLMVPLKTTLSANFGLAPNLHQKLSIVLFQRILNPVLQALIWYMCQFILRMWFQLKIEGLDNLPKDQPVLLAANHSSHLDGPATIAAANRYMNQVYSLAAKDYFFDHPIKGKICQHVLNMIPFQRQGHSTDALKSCQDLVAQNKMILLFPEGTRSKTGKLQPFKLGTGFLAMQLNVSIIPVHIEGSFQAFPKGAHFPKRHPIRIQFGRPIDIAPYQARLEVESNRRLCREIVDEIRSRIEEMANADTSSQPLPLAQTL